MLLDIYVPDGFTETRFINSLNKKWPDDTYEVTFRPPVGYETDLVLNNPTLGPGFLKNKILSWNLKKKDGTPIEKTEEEIQKLAAPFYLRLLAIVGGWAVEEDKTLGAKREEEVKN